ncbi:MAG: hypothetical protein ABI670_01010 [Chloroflexota bacterium]
MNTQPENRTAERILSTQLEAEQERWVHDFRKDGTRDQTKYHRVRSYLAESIEGKGTSVYAIGMCANSKVSLANATMTTQPPDDGETTCLDCLLAVAKRETTE